LLIVRSIVEALLGEQMTFPWAAMARDHRSAELTSHDVALAVIAAAMREAREALASFSKTSADLRVLSCL